MSTRPLATLALALSLGVGAMAQTEKPAAPTPAPAQPAVAVAGATPTQGTATRDRDTLSVDFPDEEIRTILRNVADLFELNLVIPDTLTGKTSIKLREVTWRQIFDTVLASAPGPQGATVPGFTYVEEGNIIKIVTRESLNEEPVVTEVFILNNAKAIDVKPTVDGLVDPPKGKILIDARSNALVVTERPTRMTRMRAIIEKLDKATAQVMIESQFVEVTDRDIRNIGVNWASLQGTTLGVGKMSQTYSRSRGQTQSAGYDDKGNSATTYDVVPNSINPATGSMGASANLNLPSGSGNVPATTVPSSVAVSGFSNDQGVIKFTSPVTNTQVLQDLASLTNSGATSRLTSAVFSASDFNIIVSALKSQNNTKVVSNPTIVTLNNTAAELNIGSEYPIPSYTYNQERGTFEVSGFQYKPIGIILRVTPQVNSEGNIRLNLEPEVSQQNGETTFGGAGGASIPIIATRKVKTQISIKDGYTAGIGGLIQQSQQHGGTKVPVLGSIPLVGRLFSSKSVNDQSTNLLIFITAKTVNPDGAAPNDIFHAEAMKAAGMIPDKEAAAPKSK